MSETPPIAFPPLPSGNDPAVLPNMPKWNWGAFLLTWIWALGHRMYVIALIAFVATSGLGLLASLVMGFLGNELAWKYRPFASYEEFQQVQSAWTKAGIIVAVAGVVVTIVGAMFWFMALRSVVGDMSRMPSGMPR